MDEKGRYVELSLKTADNLRSVAQSKLIRDVTTLSLPEIEAVVNLVAKVIPAGNVPGVILNGLARLPDRTPPFKVLKRDINLLFTAIDQSLDKAIYSTFFAGPAAVIWGYQNLLKLAGKDPEDAFPEGVWQFYVDYALREDTAHHANETHGFDTLLKQHRIQLNSVDRTTAWVMAAIHSLHQYNSLLRNEWRERVYTALLREITQDEPNAEHYAHLYRTWQKICPYGRGSDAAAGETYALYRRVKFDRFLETFVRDLPQDLRQKWVEQARIAKEKALPDYQRQMSILSYLDPGPYSESRRPIPLQETYVGLIYQGHYYLIPTCAPGASRPSPADVATVRMQIATLMSYPIDSAPVSLIPLTKIKRKTWPNLHEKLNPKLVTELKRLRLAPILINCDAQSPHLPLSELRQAERGVGDHALTLFDAGQTMVFDQSHIFFDGAWGAAFAEIMTQEALSWAVYLNRLPPAPPDRTRSFALTFSFHPTDLEHIQQSPQITPDVSAETDAVDLKALQELRKYFKRRNDLLQLTVNDLLILYRAIHAATYQPSPHLILALKKLTHIGASRSAAVAALDAIEQSTRVNPAIVVPVDASQQSPKARLHPMTFEVPLTDLDLLNLHDQVITALNTYEQAPENKAARYTEFDKLQRLYLASLAGFGTVMTKTKEIAVAGESAGVGHIKLLAHMPAPLQSMLDSVPNRFDLLNDIIKGREVMSNVGAVVPASSLTRFITAKDDNEKKNLVWGFITDAQGVMRISLRDFRPHVAMLEQANQKHLAVRVVQDYLDAYARGLNNFINDLRRITRTSRETGLIKLEERDG